MKKLFEPRYVEIGSQFLGGMGVLVVDGDIVEVGSVAELVANHPDAERVDWSRYALLPGTVNAHNHSFQSLIRGIAADEPFLVWRDEALYRYSPCLDAEMIYNGALFAFAEMMLNGVTTVADFFYIHDGGTQNDEAVIQAAKDLGIRFVMARTMYDWPGAPQSYQERIDDALRRTRELAIKYQGNQMIAIHPAPHSPHAASPEMIQAGHRLAKELGTPYHIHVAEEMFEVEEIIRDHGVRPVHFLDKLGVLDESMIAIHLVWLADAEIALLGQRKASLAYCPSSNMFLADGITKIPELLQSGVNICLGTDGACSNNRINVFEEMRMTSLLQKVRTLDATCIRATETYAMGTRHAGEILRLPIGKIEPGYRADFVALDLDDLSLHPSSPELLLSHVVYSMQPTAVKRVVVGGRVVVRDGELQTVSNERVRKAIAAVQARFQAIAR
ncbi:amidohydrolase [Alicyclobacillus fastidiosus]|uniref:Amidohydrolase n=1 Tax=Alicyclobacillus fastidiosus TaxID=392011 RepID=A0ABY6ZA11_9BACL|nr:amidohydrolase [Alicyclobacillus fastidiosus]WAH39720.1 amidohydrolase [Alicyclobacillus fastidiosus]GMA60945.1 N-ethylammeline chlorohydrolase [Alicyclobacillus fastidiosus]